MESEESKVKLQFKIWEAKNFLKKYKNLIDAEPIVSNLNDIITEVTTKINDENKWIADKKSALKNKIKSDDQFNTEEYANTIENIKNIVRGKIPSFNEFLNEKKLKISEIASEWIPKNSKKGINYFDNSNSNEDLSFDYEMKIREIKFAQTQLDKVITQEKFERDELEKIRKEIEKHKNTHEDIVNHTKKELINEDITELTKNRDKLKTEYQKLKLKKALYCKSHTSKSMNKIPERIEKAINDLEKKFTESLQIDKIDSCLKRIDNIKNSIKIKNFRDILKQIEEKCQNNVESFKNKIASVQNQVNEIINKFTEKISETEKSINAIMGNIFKNIWSKILNQKTELKARREVYQELEVKISELEAKKSELEKYVEELDRDYSIKSDKIKKINENRKKLKNELKTMENYKFAMEEIEKFKTD